MNGPLHPGHLTQYGILDPRDLAARQKQIALEAIEYGNEFPGFLAPWDLPLEANAMMAAPVPILGDILGLAADAKMYATEPESRTLANFGLTAAGSLPWVPNAAALGGLGGAALAMFAGPAAKTADLAAMKRAQDAIEAGGDARQVYRDTGWFQGADGQWRFEIDDSGAGLRRPIDELDKFGRPVPVDMAVNHSALYDAYPDMAETPWYRTPEIESGGGSFDPVRGVRIGGGEGYASGANGPIGTTLHELQHVAQDKEGFARGGSLNRTGLNRDELFDSARKAYEEANGMTGGQSDAELLAELFGDAPPSGGGAKPWAGLPEREKLEWLDEGRSRAYRRLAGEAEARAVQKRMDYAPEQRRNVFPLDDYDVPLDELIVRREGRR